MCNLLRYNQILLGLTASLSGVETSVFFMPLLRISATKKGVAGQGHAGAQLAVLSPVYLHWQGTLKYQYCYWSDPNQQSCCLD